MCRDTGHLLPTSGAHIPHFTIKGRARSYLEIVPTVTVHEPTNCLLLNIKLTSCLSLLKTLPMASYQGSNKIQTPEQVLLPPSLNPRTHSCPRAFAHIDPSAWNSPLPSSAQPVFACFMAPDQGSSSDAFPDQIKHPPSLAVSFPTFPLR